MSSERRVRAGVRERLGEAPALEGSLQSGAIVTREGARAVESVHVCLHRLLCLLCAERGDELRPLQAKPGIERQRAAVVDGPLTGRDRPPRPPAEPLGDGEGAVEEPVGRDHLVDEPERLGLLRGQRASVEHQSQRAGAPEQPSEPLGPAAARREPEQNLGLADPVISFGRDPDVAREGQLAATTHRRAVERGDEDCAAAVHPQQQLMEALELQDAGRRGAGERSLDGGNLAKQTHGPHRCTRRPGRERRTGTRPRQQFPDVVMGDEALEVLAGEHHGAHPLVGLPARDEILEPRHDSGIHQPAAVLASCAVSARPQLRLPFDVALSALLGLNAAVVGLAGSAYGGRLVAAAGLHTPIELAGFAAAGGAYLTARAGELSGRRLVGAAAAAASLLAAGAVVETYLQIGAAA
jgi:hypothetical protein